MSTGTWGRREPRPSIPWEDTIIYEAHVKGLTKTRLDISPDLRGSYRALAASAMIDLLRGFGVTTIELLPIHFGALAGLGHCHAQMGSLARAAESYRRALTVNPRMEGIAQVLRRLEESLPV